MLRQNGSPCRCLITSRYRHGEHFGRRGRVCRKGGGGPSGRHCCKCHPGPRGRTVPSCRKNQATVYLTAFGKSLQFCLTETLLFHEVCNDGEQKRVKLPSLLVLIGFEASPCHRNAPVSLWEKKRMAKHRSWWPQWIEKRTKFDVAQQFQRFIRFVGVSRAQSSD